MIFHDLAWWWLWWWWMGWVGRGGGGGGQQNVTRMRLEHHAHEAACLVFTVASVAHWFSSNATLTLSVSVVYNQQYIFTVRRFAVHATRTKLASGKPVPNMEL